ncbi:M20/M25/M40 family metallo-hydrolase [Maribellus sediminis]|uniref:M20/M25/M40 family metallo-hydrolase n=1 Tax=Maribellus sediminis TaxID=2696285 RepID=UPI00142FA2F5|nr:M20/M25/M40 family metallo-hydrolase [Maribellus sediminis]
MKKTAVIITLLCASAFSFAQTEAEKGLEALTMESIKSQLGFLASDWTEGRAVGTKGAYMAADYIAAMMELYGVEPFGDEVYSRPTRQEMMAGIRPTASKTFYQNFSLLQYEPGDEQKFSVVTSSPGSESAVDFAYQSDFSVNTGTVGQSAQAGLVFVGYGFKNEDEGYDDLAKIDLKGKIAVVLRGYPGHQDTSSVGYEKFTLEDRRAMYRIERDKMDRLADAGVIAVIQIIPDYDPSMSWSKNQIYPVKGAYYEADQPLSSYYTNRMAMPGKELGGSIPSFMVTPRVVNAIISGTGIDFEAFEKEVANDLKPQSQVLNGKSVAFKTSVNSEIVKARNVVGMIEGEKKDEFIVVGGHYDHLGKHDGWIWNGADDNASGTVGVLSIAKAFKATGKKPERSIIFAAWTGEEKGLYGSKYFVEQAKEKDMNVVLNLNYDMIARDTEQDTAKNMARMVYTEANYNIEEATKKYVEDYDINLDLTYSPSEKPGGGSDHAPFAEAGIPVFYYMAAMHPDYHQPSDELSKINWDKMLNIIKIGFLSTWEFANTDDWTRTKVQPE